MNKIREEPSHFEAKKLDWRGWLKYLALTALIWIGMGFAYRVFTVTGLSRDSVTDATNGIGQLLMTGLYHRAVDLLDCDQSLQYLSLVGQQPSHTGYVLGLYPQ